MGAGKWTNIHPTIPALEQIEEFARSFDGYEYWGKEALPRFVACEERFQASGELPDDPLDLRAALFLSWRAYDRGGQPGELSPFFFAVFERIWENLPNEEQLLLSQTRLRDETILEVATTDWPHPHEPVLVWHRARSWKRGPTPEQLDRARQRLLKTKKYFFRCQFCLEVSDVGWRYRPEVCCACATEHFGLLY